MKRENIAGYTAGVVVIAFLVAFWLASGTSKWLVVIAGIIGPIFSVLLIKWMKGQYQDGRLQYQDERFDQLYNRASRNALVFLIFFMPILGAILLIQPIALEAVASLFLLWGLSIVVFYGSVFYYYRR